MKNRRKKMKKMLTNVKIKKIKKDSYAKNYKKKDELYALKAK